MATFVQVHGGGHGGWCWQPVARRLRAAGHEVHAPTLTGLGERRHLLRPGIGLDTHIEDVVQLLFHEDLQDVVLVGHSYGGMVITGVADRALERLARIAYLDAAIPRDSEALVDISPGVTRTGDTREVDGVELALWPEQVGAAVYGITDPDLAAWTMPRLTPHPAQTFRDALRLARPEAVAALPRAVVNCSGTLRHRPEAIRGRWLDGDYVREIDTGHDLMLTEPDAVARMLGELAA